MKSAVKSNVTLFKKQNLDSISEEYFNQNPDEEISLLSLISNALMDLSINEISIHYIKASDIQVEKPYLDFEKKVLHVTEQFYESHFSVFLKHPEFYQKFLKSDRNTLCRILRSRSITNLDDII